jgi:hypothetical protein
MPCKKQSSGSSAPNSRSVDKAVTENIPYLETIQKTHFAGFEPSNANIHLENAACHARWGRAHGDESRPPRNFFHVLLPARDFLSTADNGDNDNTMTSCSAPPLTWSSFLASSCLVSYGSSMYGAGSGLFSTLTKAAAEQEALDERQ